MKKLIVALAALSLAGCDLREAITGEHPELSPEHEVRGGFWDAPIDYPKPTPKPEPVQTKTMETVSATDYMQRASVNEYQGPDKETAKASDYFLAADASDYEQPAEAESDLPPATVAEGEDDVLIVPKREAAPTAQVVPQKQNILTITAGDTLYSLARKHNVPLRNLITANKLEAPYALKPGQSLFLPAQFAHTVAKGETLYSISRMYQMDLNSLAQMNDMKAPFALSVGQKLILPAQIQLTAAEPTKTPAAEPEKKEDKKTEPEKKEEPKPIDKKEETKPVTPTPPPPPPAVKKPATVSTLPRIPMRSSNKFSWPLRGQIISGYGAKEHGLYNDGINIKANRGAPVSAAENGVVAYAGNEIKGLGNLVIIKHADNWMTVYAHLDTILTERGKTVAAGAKIGSAGQTGKVSSPQLHFEIRQGTRALNPVNHLKK
jgi:murein DD-endopeptidase MepM/ murein hydrolase activator NlpD